ncbi:hypothetical protein [Polaribacter sargassicola]|uniref:hypothetical protein n=1 Tax=Polaribacter sargassicola TaxID=2836891 RepID=UPI001F296736|nr:hypothetical protein [Polaribacter sp. DS7-9]MCG1035337.1 hypothetical protein [Polaribacter sp. DS7-9]
MKKIIYYDNWDKGYRNFLRIDLLFKEKGYETFLLHTSSLVEENVTVEKEIDGLKFRDFSYYKTIRLKKIIKKEKPSAIIMLNLSFMIDRAIVKICKELKIKLFHLSHGMLIPVESIVDVKETIKETSKKNIVKKINKKNRYALYNYLIEINSLSKVFNFFLKAIKNHTEYTLFPKYTSELEVEKSFVFYPSDYKVMVEEFGFPKDKVVVVGNPELDMFFNSKIKEKTTFLNDLGVKKIDYVAYFDDGLSIVHGWDSNKWMEFLEDLNGIVVEKECQLIVKLHPRRDITDCISFFNQHNIKYVLDVDFKNFIKHSKFVVSHFSSVIVYALLLNKKVKSPRWSISKGLEEKYPSEIVHYYYSKKDFEKTFFNTVTDIEATEKYLLKSIGRVDGKSTKRIVDNVLKYI